MTANTTASVRAFAGRRWLCLISAMVICVCAGFGYAWSVLQTPIIAQFGWADSGVALAYTITVVCSTMAPLLFGGLIRRMSSRLCVAVGAVLFGAGLFAAGLMSQLWQLYLFYGVISGLGVGFIYPSMMAYVVRLFPDRSGMASGLGTAAYGSGAILWAPTAAVLMEKVGLGSAFRVLGVLFAALAALASFGIGCGTQINAIAEVIENNIPVGIPPIAIGVVGGLLTGVVIIGGIQSIASVCEKLVPFMAAFYVLGCIIILAINWDFLAPAVSTILRLAFTPGAAAGGLVGQGLMAAMRFGVARGLFSNESGMGSAPLVASAAQTRNPVRQALVSATGTFWDTVVVCLMTGLVLVTTIMKNPAIDMAQISDGGQLTTLAFAQIPVLGPVILVVGIITFAWSTILGWSYYGERCAQYLWGKRALLPYKLVFVAVVVVGPVLALDLVWTIADILNALMAIPNLVAVLLLSGVVARETRHYLGNLDEVDQTEIPRVDK